MSVDVFTQGYVTTVTYQREYLRLALRLDFARRFKTWLRYPALLHADQVSEVFRRALERWAARQSASTVFGTPRFDFDDPSFYRALAWYLEADTSSNPWRHRGKHRVYPIVAFTIPAVLNVPARDREAVRTWINGPSNLIPVRHLEQALATG